MSEPRRGQKKGASRKWSLPLISSEMLVYLCLKVAVTVVLLESVTVQVPVPLHPPPLHPKNVELLPAGLAVSVTAVPPLKPAEQMLPHEMPAGELVTVPFPFPLFVTASVNWTACVLKVAVTAVLAFSVTVHVPVPLQPPPLQPAKTDPLTGAAVSVTVVPLA